MRLVISLFMMGLGIFPPFSGFAEDGGQPAAVQAESPKPTDHRAFSAEEVRYREFLASPQATAEELTKILFKAAFPKNYVPPRLLYEMQNTLKDSVLLGAIMTVTYADPETKKEQTIEVYVDLGDTMPLSATTGSVAVFQATEISKLSPKISLKEIRLRKITP